MACGAASESTVDLQKPRRVAAFDQLLFCALEPRNASYQANRIIFTHVIRIVGAEKHVPRPVLVDHLPEHPRVEADRVETHLLELARRRLLDHGPAVRSRGMRVVHARPIMSKIGAP